MKKSCSNFKIPSSCQLTRSGLIKYQLENLGHRPVQQNIDRRKHSLPVNIKSQSGLMAQIKSALKTRQALEPEKIQQRLNEAKKIMYESMQPFAKYNKKQNFACNAQQAPQSSFKNNLKQMQFQISSIKKLMQYQKAKNNKMFEQKLFTFQQKFEEHKHIDDKIQTLKDLIEQSNKTLARERKNHLEQVQKQKFSISKQDYLMLKDDIKCLKNNYVTMQDVDIRISQNLQIFKTLFIQKDKGLKNIENNNISNKYFLQIMTKIQSQSIVFRKTIDQSKKQLFQQIQALRNECHTISQSITKQQILKFQNQFNGKQTQLMIKLQKQQTKIKQQILQKIENCQLKISKSQENTLDLTDYIDDKIGKIQEQIEQMGEMLNGMMAVIKNLVKKLDSYKNTNLNQSVVSIIKQNVKEISWLKQELGELNQEVKYIESQFQPLSKCSESNIVTSACLQKSASLLIEDSFQK